MHSLTTSGLGKSILNPALGTKDRPSTQKRQITRRSVNDAARHPKSGVPGRTTVNNLAADIVTSVITPMKNASSRNEVPAVSCWADNITPCNTVTTVDVALPH